MAKIGCCADWRWSSWRRTSPASRWRGCGISWIPRRSEAHLLVLPRQSCSDEDRDENESDADQGEPRERKLELRADRDDPGVQDVAEAHEEGIDRGFGLVLRFSRRG